MTERSARGKYREGRRQRWREGRGRGQRKRFWAVRVPTAKGRSILLRFLILNKKTRFYETWHKARHSEFSVASSPSGPAGCRQARGRAAGIARHVGVSATGAVLASGLATLSRAISSEIVGIIITSK